jgi:hypothetical protein
MTTVVMIAHADQETASGEKHTLKILEFLADLIQRGKDMNHEFNEFMAFNCPNIKQCVKTDRNRNANPATWPWNCCMRAAGLIESKDPKDQYVRDMPSILEGWGMDPDEARKVILVPMYADGIHLTEEAIDHMNKWSVKNKDLLDKKRKVMEEKCPNYLQCFNSDPKDWPNDKNWPNECCGNPDVDVWTIFRSGAADTIAAKEKGNQVHDEF